MLIMVMSDYAFQFLSSALQGTMDNLKLQLFLTTYVHKRLNPPNDAVKIM